MSDTPRTDAFILHASAEDALAAVPWASWPHEWHNVCDACNNVLAHHSGTYLCPTLHGFHAENKFSSIERGVSPPPAIAASDERLAALLEVLSIFDKWGGDGYSAREDVQALVNGSVQELVEQNATGDSPK